MKIHTSQFKTNISTLGREIDAKITYGSTIVDAESLYSVKTSFEGNILKSVMKEVDIECENEIPLNTSINLQIGVMVGTDYEYLNYGNYIVFSSEFKEDTKTYLIKAYDKMLNSMKEYESLGVTYPITIENYLTALCNKIGITLKTTTFTNQDKTILNELYLDDEGNTLGYTYRDVLDEIAQVTASTICISEDDKLEIRYISNTSVDTIDGEFLKNTNVNFGKIQEPINVITLSRSGDSDIIHYPSTLPSKPVEVKIKDNQILNGNNRDEFIKGIYDRLNGLTYSVNDFSSTGVCYLDLCDRYTITIEEDDGSYNNYSCVLLNDEIIVTQGLEELIHTELMEESTTDYTKSDTTDRKVNQAVLIVNKQEGKINGLVKRTEDLEKEVTTVKETSGNNSLYVEDALESRVLEYGIDGKSKQDGTPTPDAPVEIKSVDGIRNLLNLTNNTGSSNGVSYEVTNDNQISFSGTATTTYCDISPRFTTKTLPKGTYTFSVDKPINAQIVFYAYYNDTQYTYLRIEKNTTSVTINIPNDTINFFVGLTGLTIGNTYSGTINLQLEKSPIAHSFVPYGSWAKVKINGSNALQKINFYNWVNNGNATQEKIDDYIKVNMPTTPGSATGIYFDTWSGSKKGNWKEETSYLEGKEVTFSFYAKADSERTIFYLISDNTKRYITLTTEWKRYSVTVTNFTNKQVPVFYCGNTLSTTSYYIKDIMLQKGELIDYEPYKENISLIDMNKPNLFINKVFKDNYLVLSTGEESYNSEGCIWEYIKVEPNTTYTLTYNSNDYTFGQRICEYTSDKTFIKRTNAFNSGYSFKTSSTTEYINLSGLKTDSNIKIYEGFNNYYELCSIGDIKDTLIVNPDGTATLEKKIGKVVLNGSEALTQNSGKTCYYYNSSMFPLYDNKNKILSNYFKGAEFNELYSASIDYGISLNLAYNRLTIRHKDITDLTQFKTWLSTNNVEVYYVLAEPYTIDLGQVDISLFENINHINLLDDIETETRVKYLINNVMNGTYATKGELELTNEQFQTTITNEFNSLERQMTSITQTGGAIDLAIQSSKDYTDSKNESLDNRITNSENNYNDLNNKYNTLNGKITDMNFSFKTDGLTIGTSGSEINSKLDNKGLKIYNASTLIAIFNQNGSGFKKLIATESIQLQNLLIQKRVINTPKANNMEVISFFFNKSLIENLTDLESD